MKMNYYEILGIKKDAATEEIKAAYRKLSKKHHPDAGGDHEVYTQITEAYSVLIDPEKRRYYDEHGEGPGVNDADAVLYRIAIVYAESVIKANPKNPLEWIMKCIDDEIAVAEAMNEDIEETIESIQDFRDRIVSSPEKDIISDVLDRNQRAQEQKLESNEARIMALMAVKDMFEGYEFKERKDENFHPQPINTRSMNIDRFLKSEMRRNSGGRM